MATTTPKVGKTINGGKASETLIGTDYADIIFGGGGDDTIRGGGGADKLRGGAGNDTLTGGAGNDVFVFESTLALNGVDTITDLGFKRGGVVIGSNDVLDLSLALTSSKVSSQTIGNYVKIMDNKLYVDLDGTGAGVAQVWANLSGLQAGDKVNVRTTSFDGWVTVSAGGDTSAPTFEGTTSFTYDENQSAGATVATISGFSDNVGVTEYRFCDSGGTSGGANSGDWWFQISSGGVITMTGSGAASEGNDYESGASQSHQYYVQARDAAGNWSAAQAITLGENDVSEDTIAPSFEGTSSFTYDENQSGGATIATIDGFYDAVGVTGYRFSDSGGTSGGSSTGDGWFTISSGGVITMTGSGAALAGNDYESGASQSHEYYVQARDAAGNWSAAQLITLGENDLDDTAPFFGEGTTYFTYDENQSGGATIATMDGFTDDVGVTEYRFSDSGGTSGGSSTGDGWFTISSGGVITMTASGSTSDANDYEAGASQSHTYYVQARDAAGNWSVAQEITLDENDVTEDTTAPFFEGTSSFTYNENQSAGATIATMDGFTDDVGVTGYRFSDSGGTSGGADSGDSWFSISSGGVITMTGSGASSSANDYETGVSQSHTYYVQARDAAGNWSAAQAITLGENNLDDTAPAFEGTSSFTYDENRSGGATVATISGFTDAVGVTGYRFSDSGGTSGGATAGDGWFSISSGGVITMTGSGAASAANDYEAGASQSHTYYVQARDAAGNWSAAQTITLGENNLPDTFISVSGHSSASGGPVWLDTDQDGVKDSGETALFVDGSGGIHTGSVAGDLVDFTKGAWKVKFWDVLGPKVNLTGFSTGDEAIIDMSTHTQNINTSMASYMGYPMSRRGNLNAFHDASHGAIYNANSARYLSVYVEGNAIKYGIGYSYITDKVLSAAVTIANNFNNLSTLTFIMPSLG